MTGPLAPLFATVREALVRPYKAVKEPAFFALDELPEFEALSSIEQWTADAVQHVQEDVEEWERIAAEKGLPFLLDHLGLDGLANEVVERERHVQDIDDENRRLKSTPPLTRIAELEAVNTQLARYVRRLTDAMEQIASDIHPARPVDEERPRWMHENSVWWNHYSPQEIARAALPVSNGGPDGPAGTPEGEAREKGEETNG